jgi:hypothetical protein
VAVAAGPGRSTHAGRDDRVVYGAVVDKFVAIIHEFRRGVNCTGLDEFPAAASSYRMR